MEKIEMQSTDRKTMFLLAEKYDWSSVQELIKQKTKNCSDITNSNDDLSGKTLLHYACSTPCRNAAKNAVEMILGELNLTVHNFDDVTGFVNAVNSSGQTGLHICLQKSRYDIIDILLDHGADLWIKFDSSFSHQYKKVLLKVLDKGTDLLKCVDDELDQSQWIFSCNFSLITGKENIVENSKEKNATEHGTSGNQIDIPQNVTASTETAQTSGLQAIDAHDSDAPTTNPPSIDAPATDSLKTDAPTTVEPTTVEPTTVEPTTVEPTTVEPTTVEPTTVEPTTVEPTTVEPTTVEPTRKGKVLKTKLFAKILSLPEEKRYPILMHPLVHMFVLEMCHKFRKPILASIIYQFIWYILAAIVIMMTLTSILKSNPTPVDNTAADNSTIKTSIIENNLNTIHTWFIVIVWIFLFGTIAKEIFEFLYCPSKIYHIKQIEKIAQYIVIIAVIVALTVGESAKNLADWLQFITSTCYSVGFLATPLLVQGQLSKRILSGIHNHMMIKGFKKLLMFMAMFAIVYVAFALFFHILLPGDPMYSGPLVGPKILTMQTGELNFNEIFTKERMKKKYFFIVPTVVVLVVFIIAVVTLFPIVLFGLAIESLSDLRNEANAAHVASRLELANLLESLFALTQKLFSEEKPAAKKSKNAIKSSIRNEALPLEFECYTFQKIPDNIKQLIYKNKATFPNGFDDDCL